jgi:hypothetical protein
MGLALGKVERGVAEDRAQRGMAELGDTRKLLDDAVLAAIRASGDRGSESPGERMKRLRDAVETELVSFHDRLPVTPYDGDQWKAAAGHRLFRVGIPLTLFPKRDHGFSRVECLVQFARGEDERGIRVVEVRPPARSEVLAQLALGARLGARASGEFRLDMPSAAGRSVAEVAQQVYAVADAGPFVHRVVRVCVETEIVRGSGARWRLDDSSDPQRVGVEGHQFEVVLEVAPGAAPVSAAGYLQAYSDARWLSRSLGSFLRDFPAALRALFDRGVPLEAYAEWDNILSAEASADPASE